MTTEQTFSGPILNMRPLGLNETEGIFIELDDDKTGETMKIELGYCHNNYWSVVVHGETDGCQDATVTEALDIIWKYYEPCDEARAVVTIHGNTTVSVNLLCYDLDDETDGTTVEFTVWDVYDDLPIYELR